MIDKVCINCGVAFDAPTKRAVFCSTYCRIFFNRILKDFKVKADATEMQKNSEFEFPDDIEAIAAEANKRFPKTMKALEASEKRLGKAPKNRSVVRKISIKSAKVVKKDDKREAQFIVDVAEGNSWGGHSMTIEDTEGAYDKKTLDVWKDNKRPVIDDITVQASTVATEYPYDQALRLAKSGDLTEGQLLASSKRYKYTGNQISMIRSKMKQ